MMLPTRKNDWSQSQDKNKYENKRPSSERVSSETPRQNDHGHIPKMTVLMSRRNLSLPS
jgi:hypothetical protein